MSVGSGPNDNDVARVNPRAPESVDSGRTTAEVIRGWWPGWIWAVPIAVVLIVGWLGLRYLTSGGENITITFANAHGIKAQNTSIVYRGLTIGQVKSVALNKTGTGVVVAANIDDEAAGFLRSGTRFWLRGANPSLGNLSSLGAILSGPTIVMAPGAGKPATHFAGSVDKPIAPAHAHPQSYIVTFKGAVGALQPGDTVTLRGFTIGKVTDVGFHYDVETGVLSTPVTLALYPARFHLTGLKHPDSPAALRTAVAMLIGKGLRARLERDPPLIGAYRVTLDMVPGAPKVSSSPMDGTPVIPAAGGGGLGAIVSRLKKLPIDQVAQNLVDITHHVNSLVSNPRLEDAIVQLDDALKQIHGTATDAGPKLTQLIATLRRTATQLDLAVKSARRVVGGEASQSGLHQAVRELTEAARSVRELADYLDRHPGALIRGRSGR